MTRQSNRPLSALVDGEALMGHVRALARWVKLSGTAEERESFDYLQAEMDRLGYRTRLIEHPAYIGLPGKARVEIDGRALGCITHSLARSSPPEGVSGELVDLGRGGKAAFAGRDLRGRIALIEGLARPEDAKACTDAGALGQIHISPDHQLHEMCVSPVWGSPSWQSRGRLPGTVVVTISRQDGLALRECLARGERPKAVLHAEVDTGWRTIPILEAELSPRGAAKDAPFVMFSGHVDTWYCGAMDNGTANATMLEIARIAALERGAWRRGLRLCFWSGHSHGRYAGSAWYADARWHELEARCLAHVNIDSTGGKGASVLTNSGSAAELRDLAAEVIERHTGQIYGGRRIARQADESFWGIGLPAMFGSLSHQPPPADKSQAHMHLGWWWHTPEDTVDKIDPANLLRDAKVFADVIWRLLADAVPPIRPVPLADDLVKELGKLSALEGRFELSGLRDSAASLLAKAKRVEAAASAAKPSTAARLTDGLMRFSRALVPMDSTAGDRFDHDPALPQPVWPVLQPLRDLTATPPGTEDWHFREVGAMRARNRMLHALGQAHAALDLALPAPRKKSKKKKR